MKKPPKNAKVNLKVRIHHTPTDHQSHMISLLGRCGFSYKCIGERVFGIKPQDPLDKSYKNMIRNVFNHEGISLNAYRNGSSSTASTILTALRKDIDICSIIDSACKRTMSQTRRSKANIA